MSVELIEAKKDGDKAVFKAPLIENCPKGFMEVKSHFVDSSGFGAEGEPALTALQFLARVKAGRFYGITGQGQFQVYVTEYEKIK